MAYVQLRPNLIEIMLTLKQSACSRALSFVRPPGRRPLRVSAFKQDPGTERSRRSQNVAGDFYVDHTCIDCDTCRWMAPEVFGRVDEQSAVIAQPVGEAARVRTMQALLSCPTYSIHTDRRTAAELTAARSGLPAPVPGVPGVYHCGWHSEKSFGAASYIITRSSEAGGNIMVDCPRFNPVLARQIEALGGVSTIFLTHKDDVCDHEAWARHFKARRIIHEADVNSGLTGVETKLKGSGPWRLDGTPLNPSSSGGSSTSSSSNGGSSSGPSMAESDTGAAHVPEEDIVLVFTPGHTEGCVCLYHHPTRTLFAGDHLASAADVNQPRTLAVFKDFNWYSFPLQLRSVEALLPWDWVNVLPGHGRMAFLGSLEARNKEVARLLAHYGHAQTATAAATK